jgi:predicted O-linked N-acetylglucosamine transferase (SPINDLY family)
MLDTFPYNGQTTTCEALWMGVPVVTLPCDTHVSRVGAGLLRRLGRPEWIADSVDSYAGIATELVADVNRLSHTRQHLRANFVAAGLTDGPSLTRALEDAYRSLRH